MLRTFYLVLGLGIGAAMLSAQDPPVVPPDPEVTGWKLSTTTDLEQRNCPTSNLDTAHLKDGWPVSPELCAVKLGDSIEVTVKNGTFKPGDEIVLWMDGSPMPLAAAGRTQKDATEEVLKFELPESLPSSDGRESWLRILREPLKKRESIMTVGTKTGPPIARAEKINPFFIRRISEKAFIWWALIWTLVVILAFYLAVKTNLLRDDAGVISAGDTDLRAYSLAKTQALCWTLVVAGSYTFIWRVTWNENTLNPQILVLLGIAIGTTVLGSVVNGTREGQAIETLKSNAVAIPTAPPVPGAAPPAVDQAVAVLTTNKNEQFFKDLVTDGNGVSVVRVQMVLFTIILMVVFITQVARTLVMPEFPNALLGLMGLSSSGYLGMKTIEKK